jgi:D-3-phosphoglycerate dehydrogenase
MRILIASAIDPDAVEALEHGHDVVRAFNAHEEQLAALLADREVLVFRSGVRISAAVLQAAPRLRLLVRAGSGLDNVDVACALSRGVRVVRVPGSSAQPVAEFTFALLLSLVRKVSLADRLLRQGHWPKAQLGGPLLTGKTLGIVGAGNIGSRVGELGAAWGMRVIGCVATPSPRVENSLAAKGITLTDFDTVVSRADFLCIHVPLDDSTRHLVDARVLSHMKHGSYLVNVARGGVVDEEALYPELTEGGTLLGAAMDVHEHEGEGTTSPFADLPNVVLTPHIGAMALDSQRLIGQRVVDLVEAYQDGRLDEVLAAEEVVEAPADATEGIAS